MEVMARYPDKYFDLAVVDPPYGLGERTTKGGGGRNSQSRKWPIHEWDSNIPSKEYFNELFRISENYIVWGGNYMIEHLKNCRCFIVWDKMVYIPSMSRIEMALTSFDKLPQLVEINNSDANRQHPTQKPIALYSWIFKNYAKEGDKILDTHLGSGSSRIAAHKAGLDFVGCELDKEYFEAQEKRYNLFISQTDLFGGAKA
jgi:site-specific DNA-methyltransferase (adenine-specific)